MTKRFAFLLGTLCGLVLGGLLVSFYFVNQPASVTSTPLISSPQQFVVPVDLNSVDIPDDWQRREFDGQPFYLIPLAAHHSDQQA